MPMPMPMLTLRSRLAAAAAPVLLIGFACAPASTPAPAAAPAAAPALGYHVVASYVVGGEGGWDYVSLDSVGHRIFVTRGDRVMVLDQKDGHLLGEIPGLQRGHGVAFSYRTGHGFATSGSDSTVIMFDLVTLKVLGRTTAADDADGVFYDPVSDRIVTMNGDANSASIIDPATGRRIGNVALGGKPEFGASAGNGKLYANLEDTAEIVEFDPATMRATRHWSIAPCESPTGLAVDRVHHRLFSGCRNKLMAISDLDAGRLVTTVPIGSGVDANAYDPATGNAFASNGDGTLTVVHEDSPSSFSVAETVPTMPGARTMALDPVTHRVYTVSAQFGPMPDTPAAGGRRRRPPMLPGSFTLMVLAPR